MNDRLPIRRALVSVYDKTGLADLGKVLAQAGVEIVSTGSTASTLAASGVPVIAVESVTGFPECLDGRVKTLHPAIHAGLLADRRLESHREALRELGIAPFDLVVSNLYPFAETVASGAGIDECVEQIDIGGPSMVRGAAKNHPSVAIVTSPGQYPELVAALAAGGYTLEQRKALAAAAFVHTATYDIAVASWMGSVLTDSSGGDGFPVWMGGSWDKVGGLRYGENSHQVAALYAAASGPAGLTQAEQLHGKEMSFNNYTDGDAAYRAAYDFAEPAVAIIKHANPCGIAVGTDIAEAHRLAQACDPVSAFGGVIAVNRPLSVEAAAQIAEIFTEVVIAPDDEAGSLEILGRKKNLRVLDMDVTSIHRVTGFDQKRVMGGVLAQEWDMAKFDRASCDPVSKRKPTPAEWESLAFAWNVAKHVKSNAIVFATANQTIGIGAGQMSRIDSVKIAISKAQQPLKGTVVASDGFFPFRDNVDAIAKTGALAIIQPGGSVKDEEVVKAADELGLSMVFTGKRHFKH